MLNFFNKSLISKNFHYIAQKQKSEKFTDKATVAFERYFFPHLPEIFLVQEQHVCFYELFFSFTFCGDLEPWNFLASKILAMSHTEQTHISDTRRLLISIVFTNI